MAENFLQCPQQTKGMEEVGEQYFNDLLSMSFFQQSSGYKMHFVMHDLLNDLAKYVCGDFCFRLEVDEAQGISKMTRHFSHIRNEFDASERFESLFKANKLRTFLPVRRHAFDIFDKHNMSSSLIHDLLSHFKCLRVLSFSYYGDVVELPNSIGNLKYLRYLDLSGTKIKKLPDSTCLLYNLQILKLNSCDSLEELPLNLHKLTNLRHLDFRETEVKKMPMHWGKLKNLQVLSPFYVGEGCESNMQQLGELDLHGTLPIIGLQNIVNPLDASAANLKNKTHLVELELEWSKKHDHDESQKEKEVLEKLQASKMLKRLSIRYYGGTGFPDWFGDNSLPNLVSLTLINCKYCVVLPPLGLLPSLKVLYIGGLDGIVVIGAEFYGSSSSSTISFPSLETFELRFMKELEEWECKNVRGAFPRLRQLSIMDCPKLKGNLPGQIPSLIELVIVGCQQLAASVPCMETSLLERLEIYDCPNMNIPMRHCHSFLRRLSIHNSCDSLIDFPLDFFPKLNTLYLTNCRNLEMISVLQQERKHGSLTSLEIRECPKFVSFPRGGFSAPRLAWFEIKKLENLKSLPECMHTLFPSLGVLRIGDCPQLESFSAGGLPSKLEYLYLSNCSKLMASLKWALETNTSLVTLDIRDVDFESFPDQGLLPVSLTSLDITGCPYLKKLDYKGLSHLSSLTTLHFRDCPRLQCLPDEGLPKSILYLEIEGNCSKLKQRCQKPKGEDWGKIAHIQHVQIDGHVIT